MLPAIESACIAYFQPRLNNTDAQMQVLRVSARAHAALKDLAVRERRTLTAQIEIIIERAVDAVTARDEALSADEREVDKASACVAA